MLQETEEGRRQVARERMERDLAKMEGKRYDRPSAKGRDPEDEWMDS